jgi:hypothetical protein
MLPSTLPLLKSQLELPFQFQLDPKIRQFGAAKSVEEQQVQWEAAQFGKWESEYDGRGRGR